MKKPVCRRALVRQGRHRISRKRFSALRPAVLPAEEAFFGNDALLRTVASDGRSFAESLPPLSLLVALLFHAVPPSAFGSGGRRAVCALRRILRFSRSRKRLLAALCPGQHFCPRPRRGAPSPSLLLPPLPLPFPCARMQARHGRHGRPCAPSPQSVLQVRDVCSTPITAGAPPGLRPVSRGTGFLTAFA